MIGIDFAIALLICFAGMLVSPRRSRPDAPQMPPLWLLLNITITTSIAFAMPATPSIGMPFNAGQAMITSASRMSFPITFSSQVHHHRDFNDFADIFIAPLLPHLRQ